MSAFIPLAWLQLTREKRRFIAASAGIAFAVVLILMQVGFEDALLSTSRLVHDHLAGDLILISPRYQYILSAKPFTERRLYQALGCADVESVASVYVGAAPFKNPFDRSERDIFLVGFNPASAALQAQGIEENLDTIRTPGAVLFDSVRRPEFGPVAETYSEGNRVFAHVGGHVVEIAGLFRLGSSFAIDGILVMSDDTFLGLMPGRSPGIIDIGLITLKPGADPLRAKAELVAMLPADVHVLTHSEFGDMERTYWISSTPIGFVFNLGVLMGLFVGCIIVYQILYTDVTDHLREYATLKAMGYRDGFFVKVVLQESLILSVLGFLPGLLVSYFVYGFARDATLLPLQLTLARVTSVYVLTVTMCAISGILAMRRLKAADPADIF